MKRPPNTAAQPRNVQAASGALALIAVLLLAVTILLAAVTLLMAGCGRATPVNSGVQGEVRIGPISPVERQGVPNDRPYEATLRVKRASDGKVVAETRSGPDGFFKVALPAGRYILDPVNGTPYPIARPQDFTVAAGQYTTVNVAYDTGIR